VLVSAQTSATFSNNQCFLDDPNNFGLTLVVEVSSQASIIAMGNLVKGPIQPSDAGAHSPSMELLVPSSFKIAPVTVIGNITSSGISVVPSGMPAAMVPLNIIV